MGKLMVIDHTKNTLFEGLGITEEECFACYKALAKQIEENILETSTVIKSPDMVKIELTDYIPEYIQTVCETLDKELTPELGLAIGLILADIEQITDKVTKMLLIEGKI